jgi:transposase InsO family protein
VRAADWEPLFIAIDDHARVAFTERIARESFLANAHALFSALNARPWLLTNNGSAFRSRSFKVPCQTLGLKQRFTRPTDVGFKVLGHRPGRY